MLYLTMKHATFKRVLREVREANDDFFNLRTVISPDTVGDDDMRFFFMMIPNDGAMAHQTLVGTFYIPEVCCQRVCNGSEKTQSRLVTTKILRLNALTMNSCFRDIPSHLQLYSCTLALDDTMSMFSDQILRTRRHAAPCVSTSSVHTLKEELGSLNIPFHHCSRL